MAAGAGTARPPAAPTAAIARPQRWDQPFDPNMTDDLVAVLLKRPEFAAIDASRFPPSTPLAGILKNDCRIVNVRAGDIVVREGDYGNSAFLVLRGELVVVVSPGLPDSVLGRRATRRKSWWQALRQLWQQQPEPEMRDTSRYGQLGSGRAAVELEHVNLIDQPAARELFDGELPEAGYQLAAMPPLKPHFETATLRAGQVFGEIAALGRVRRTATVYARTPAVLLEIRWQGLNYIRRYDESWRHTIDESYRVNQLTVQLRQHPLLARLDDATLQRVADQTLFETYGSFEWYRDYKRGREGTEATHETFIAREGDYTDGMLLIGAGFARVSVRIGERRRTLTHLRYGDVFGFDELYTGWREGRRVPLETSLSALGYVHALRIPARVLEELVFPGVSPPTSRLADAAARPLAEDALLEFAVERHFINGTKAMLIDLDRCVRCDDCVRACARAHQGNPRFVRHGPTRGRWMVANACMHCVDPVCMIGCPTGAIHRAIEGQVVVNDDTCIGCATCANACPYENIRLVDIRDLDGRPVRDSDTQRPIMKATKCDLCIDQPGGPACVRACPHDALARVDFREGRLAGGGLR